MAVPPIVKATIQAAVINAGSNVLAQGIKAYRHDVSIFPHTSLVSLFLVQGMLVYPNCLLPLRYKMRVDVPQRRQKKIMDGRATKYQ